MMERTDREIGELRRRYLGAEEDFDKLEHYLRAVWTRIDWGGHSGLFITWDDYFGREKLVAEAGIRRREI